MKDPYGLLVAVGAMAALLIAGIALVSCNELPASSAPKFSAGEVVEIAQTEEKVTILSCHSRYPSGYAYWCRVASPVTVTHNGLVSRDSEVSRYSEVRFLEFELRPTEKGQ